MKFLKQLSLLSQKDPKCLALNPYPGCQRGNPAEELIAADSWRGHGGAWGSWGPATQVVSESLR